MQTRNLTLAAVLLLASCVAPPPQPAPRAAPTPPPVAAKPAPAPRLSGDWTYRRDNQGSVGSFGAPGQNAKVSLRCDAQNRRLYLAREASAGQKMVIRTSSSSKEFATRPRGTNPLYVTAEILPNDAILDAMAFSRGRILLDAEGQQPVVLPSWAEITRIVEDCRG